MTTSVNALPFTHHVEVPELAQLLKLEAPPPQVEFDPGVVAAVFAIVWRSLLESVLNGAPLPVKLNVQLDRSQSPFTFI